MGGKDTESVRRGREREGEVSKKKTRGGERREERQSEGEDETKYEGDETKNKGRHYAL